MDPFPTDLWTLIQEKAQRFRSRRTTGNITVKLNWIGGRVGSWDIAEGEHGTHSTQCMSAHITVITT